MTEAEALEKSGIVVAALFPEWWQPAADHGDDFWPLVAKPPPNLLEPANFDRALAAILPKYAVVFSLSDDGHRHCGLWTPRPRRIEKNADNHREALLLALFDLVTREKR